jgi:hypothetical protein
VSDAIDRSLFARLASKIPRTFVLPGHRADEQSADMPLCSTALMTCIGPRCIRPALHPARAESGQAKQFVQRPMGVEQANGRHG